VRINSSLISDASFYRPSARAKSSAQQNKVAQKSEVLEASRKEPADNRNTANRNTASQAATHAEAVTLSSSKAISAPHNASHINFYRSSDDSDVSKRKLDALTTYRRNSEPVYSADGKAEFVGIDLRV